MTYNKEFQLNIEELKTIEDSMIYRLKRLTTRRLTVKKDSSKEKIDIDDLKVLINFSGDYKFDIFINECLSGNIQQYKKIISEQYNTAVNQILLLRILSISL